MCNRYNKKNMIFNKILCNDKFIFANKSLLSDNFKSNKKPISGLPDSSFTKKYFVIFC